MEERNHCFQCGNRIDALVYAVYRGSKSKNEEAADDVIGYLCDSCRGTHKVKALKSTNNWQKLDQLKKLLES